MMNIDGEAGWDRFISTIAQEVGGAPVPSVTSIADAETEADNQNLPYRILVSTIISLRTKDAVTIDASMRLFKTAPDMKTLAALGEETIADLIYPAGFYRVKAGQLRKIAELLKDKGVPAEREKLLELPGVGRKTANLVLGLAFGIPAICVDIHVHRISNRLGLIRSRNPDESEKALEQILPARFWIGINTLLVAFGQQVCTPVSPWCSRCPFAENCPRVGVERFR
jgi:endonuclease-3